MTPISSLFRQWTFKLKLDRRLLITAFKTAVAATLAALLCQLFHLQYHIYAVIAAIIVMSTTVGSTRTLGIQRIIGTVIGAIFGAVIASYLGSYPWTLGMSVFLPLVLTSVGKYPEAAKLSGYVSAIVLLSQSDQPWIYAWERFLETALGIGAALLINHWLFPASVDQELRRCLAHTLAALAQFYELIIQGAFSESYDREQAEQLKAQIIPLFQTGRPLWRERQSTSAIPPAWEFLVRRLWEHLLTMEHAVLARSDATDWQQFASSLTPLIEEIAIAFAELQSAIRQQPLRCRPDLAKLVIQAEQQMLNWPQSNLDQVNELLRFVTFFYITAEVGRKLQKMTELL